jgi:hypothetical protein
MSPRAASLALGFVGACALLAPATHSQAAIGFDQKLFETNGSTLDGFGRAIAVSPAHLLIGANANDLMGSVFAYQKVAGEWTLQQVFAGDDTANGDFFAFDLALDGTTLAVTAFQHDALGTNSGAAYVFDFIDGDWTQTAKLLAPDGLAFDRFGRTVAIDGDVIVVGASSTDDLGGSSGSAYVFRKVADTWTFEQELHASTGDANDQFGWDAHVDGGTVLVSAIEDEVAGALFEFTWNGSTWTETERIAPPVGASGDWFGWEFDVEDGRLLVGTPNHLGTGAVWSFEEAGSTWISTQKLVGSSAASNDSFGWSLSASGPRVLIGAPGTPGMPTSPGGLGDGVLYTFHHNGVEWVEVQRCFSEEISTTGFPPPQLGMACALLGKTAFGGAPFGHGTTQNQAGAAYRFDISDVGLDAVPDEVPLLGVLALENHGGFPGEGGGVYLIDISGIPVEPLLVATDTFDADGKWDVAFPMPASASGNTAILIGAGFWKPGKVGFSGLVDVSFQ